MKATAVFLFLSLLMLTSFTHSKKEPKTFDADHSFFQYTGRIDFSDPKKPKFWAPGVYITARFKGKTCDILINDQAMGGNTFNYLEVIIDQRPPVRLQTTQKENVIHAATDLSSGEHTITIVKNTETNIGYVEFVGLRVDKLLPPPARPQHKLEFIGDSITCGTGTDKSEVLCGKGKWHDQHNAYFSYGPMVSRSLNAEWQVTGYSGIGLTRSCCGIKFTMPDVYDKVQMQSNEIPWDFSKYQPDALMICLGQNDGMQDSVKYGTAYVKFIKELRGHYPAAQIVLLSSPMAGGKFITSLQNRITGVVNYMHESGDAKVSNYFFTKSWNAGCDRHPSLAEHAEIADELTPYLRKTMGW